MVAHLPTSMVSEKESENTGMHVAENETRTDISPKERIIAAARRLFFLHGFGAVTTDMLAREAATSKATLYKYFPEKSDILSAVVEGEGHRFWIDIGSLPSDREGYHSALSAYGRGFLDLLSDPEVRNFEHLMISEARAHPSGAQTFFICAQQRTLDELTRIIAVGQDAGHVRSDHSAATLADMLICAWKGMTHARLQLGLEEAPYTDRDAHVARCIAIILSI